MEACWRPATSDFMPITYLCAPHTDDPVDVASSIVEEGNGDGVLAGWQPVAFGGRVDLEDVSSGAEDGLLPGRDNRRGSVSHLRSYSTDLPQRQIKKL